MIRLKSNKRKLTRWDLDTEKLKPDANREEFYYQLQDLLDEMASSKLIVILGNFNTKTSDAITAGVKQRFNEDVKDENGYLILDFCSTNQLLINNTF